MMSATYPIKKMIGIRHLNHLAGTHGWPYVTAWAHRVSGVLLACYLIVHIATLSALHNPELFASKMKLFSLLFGGFLEWALAVPVIYHCLNGGRLLLYEIFGNRRDQLVLGWVLNLSLAYIILLGLVMLLGNQQVSAVLFWLYMFVASIFLTVITVRKIGESNGAAGWKLQRISAAFLFVMIPAHMLFMHLDPAVGRDAQVIISRMSNPFIKVVDLLLVCAALYHSGYGLRGIARDYLVSHRLQVMSSLGIYILLLYFAWRGVKLIFSV